MYNENESRNTENVARFEALMAQVNREGIAALMEYIRNKSDFYTAPASTKFHLSCEGGLLQHSLNVYDCLQAKKENSTWACILEDAGKDALILCPLLHDLCKTHFYKIDFKNQKTYDPEKVKAAERWQVKKDNAGAFIWESVPCYTVDDRVPYGHGEKSVMMVEQFMRLTGPERFAIRWHMGFSEPPQNHLQLTQAMAKYPLILALHEADQEASVLLEDKDGNKKQPDPEQNQAEAEGCDFQEADPVREEAAAE